MEERFLFIVEHAFQISGRGCVLVPGLPTEPGGPTVRVGSQIRLVTPEGETLDTRIRGLEMLNYGARRPEKLTVPILVSADVIKEQIPSGTKVFLADAACTATNDA